jgi:hypothetical protein
LFVILILISIPTTRGKLLTAAVSEWILKRRKLRRELSTTDLREPQDEFEADFEGVPRGFAFEDISTKLAAIVPEDEPKLREFVEAVRELFSKEDQLLRRLQRGETLAQYMSSLIAASRTPAKLAEDAKAQPASKPASKPLPNNARSVASSIAANTEPDATTALTTATAEEEEENVDPNTTAAAAALRGEPSKKKAKKSKKAPECSVCKLAGLTTPTATKIGGKPHNKPCPLFQPPKSTAAPKDATTNKPAPNPFVNAAACTSASNTEDYRGPRITTSC